VVGWAMSERIDQQLVLDALNMALGQGRPQAGLIHHTDQGRQYSSTAYIETLKKNGMVQSMSRRGNCYDKRGGRELLQLTEERTRQSLFF
jgi:putative transposase